MQLPLWYRRVLAAQTSRDPARRAQRLQAMRERRAVLREEEAKDWQLNWRSYLVSLALDIGAGTFLGVAWVLAAFIWMLQLLERQ